MAHKLELVPKKTDDPVTRRCCGCECELRVLSRKRMSTSRGSGAIAAVFEPALAVARHAASRSTSAHECIRACCWCLASGEADLALPLCLLAFCGRVRRLWAGVSAANALDD